VSNSDDDREAGARGLDRRELLRRGALGAAAVGALPLLGAGAAQAQGSKLSAGDLATIRKFLGPINPKFSGKGETWKIGGLFPFSTAGSVYGIVQANGLKLGALHVEALGGPKFEIDFRDHAGGDAIKGRNAMLAYKGEKLPALISSYSGVQGAIVPQVGRYKMLTIDPGGGNPPPFDHKPYFYGLRALYGLDGLALATVYQRRKLKLSKVVILFPDLGAFGTQYSAQAKARIEAAGGKVVHIMKPKYLATDYSDTLSALRAVAGEFEAVSCGIFGLDTATFLKQYKTSGIDKPIFTWEGFLAPTVKAATLQNYEGVYLGGVDDFSSTSPNPWARIFAREYRAGYQDFGVPSATPDYYSAGYYNSAFILWRLYRDVKAKGGNVNNGAHLLAALEANPSFPGVLGGSATKAGVQEFDLASHGLKHQPMALYQIRKGVPVKLASSDISGRSPKIVA
jgi:ABC-type branched-subunit amino acid transport system substrate-binding protein